METIGKVLSITLLTIFGSAAATVYLVDTDFLPSLFEYAHVVQDQTKVPEAPDISINSNYRVITSDTYTETQVAKSPTYDEDNNSIWGQNYSTTTLSDKNQSQRVVYLARVNSLASLKENLRYWDKQYKNARKQGQSRNASLAHSNYKDYKKAIEIKSNTERN